MMMKAHNMMAQTRPVMTGEVDKDFVAVEVGASKARIVMAHAEMMRSTAADKASTAALLSETRGTTFRPNAAAVWA
jgi:hypothetical protein